MSQSVERGGRTIIDDLRTQLGEYYGGVNIEVGGEVIEETEETYWLWTMLAELSFNCVENRVEGDVTLGAKNIWITFREGVITIEDDFVYEDPLPVLERVEAIKQSGRPKTTKPVEEGETIAWGGMGIYASMLKLKKVGGELKYREEGGRIVTEVVLGDWQNYRYE